VKLLLLFDELVIEHLILKIAQIMFPYYSQIIAKSYLIIAHSNIFIAQINTSRFFLLELCCESWSRRRVEVYGAILGTPSPDPTDCD
jgi:hypothetical protein